MLRGREAFPLPRKKFEKFNFKLLTRYEKHATMSRLTICCGGVIAGLVIDNCHKPLIQLVGMIAGTIVCYLFGTVWFCIVADSTFKAALGICVIPFIPADLIKMIIAMIIGPMIKKRIR